MPPASPNYVLLFSVLVAVGCLVLLVARFKLNAFVALVLASLFVGLCAGLNPVDIAKAFQDGVGGTLGFIAVVVGLGTMLGKMLAESGGAAVVAETFVRVLGPARLPWAMVVVAFVVGLPVFFGVGVVLLIPVMFTLLRQTRLPVLSLGIPLVAGLSVSHGLVPPHPGPMVAIGQLGADVGKTILYALLVGVPTAVVAGPLFGSIVARRIEVAPGGLGERLVAGSGSGPTARPGFGITLFTILLPVLLMLVATVAEVFLPKGHPWRPWAAFIGSPLMAMLLAVLFSFYTFGVCCGFHRDQVLKFTDDCVGPAAGIMLVVGAGGGFSKVLDVSGADDAIAAMVRGLSISPLLLGWLIAALIRVAVGSATVTITMAASLIAPVLAANPGTSPELMVLALGAGSLILSHLNDGGFWFVKEYLNLTVTQTLKTWTVLETIIAVVALLLVLLLDLVI